MSDPEDSVDEGRKKECTFHQQHESFEKPAEFIAAVICIFLIQTVSLTTCVCTQMVFSSDYSGNLADWTAIPTGGFSKIMLNVQNLLWTFKKSNLHSVCVVFCIWVYRWSNFVHFVTVAHRFSLVVVCIAVIPGLYFRRSKILYMAYTMSVCSDINSTFYFIF